MIKYENFCGNSKSWVLNSDAKAVFDFLCMPENIHNMIVMSNLGLPAISGLVKELETRFANSPTFPLTEGTNRQLVGKMAKHILGYFGYEPVANGQDERGQLRNFTGAKIFKTASVYALNNPAKCSLTIEITKSNAEE